MGEGIANRASMVTRRSLLKGLIAVSAGSTLGGSVLVGRGSASTEPTKAAHQWAFVKGAKHDRET